VDLLPSPADDFLTLLLLVAILDSRALPLTGLGYVLRHALGAHPLFGLAASHLDVTHPLFAGTTLLVPPSRQKHGAALPPGSDAEDASPAERMRHKLAAPEGRALYKMRKAIVEPVFGQIKETRQLRQFLLRGHQAAQGEFALFALTHNLLKLFRSGAGRIVPALV
jgi:hypothetical protein